MIGFFLTFRGNWMKVLEEGCLVYCSKTAANFYLLILMILLDLLASEGKLESYYTKA